VQPQRFQDSVAFGFEPDHLAIQIGEVDSRRNEVDPRVQLDVSLERRGQFLTGK